MFEAAASPADSSRSAQRGTPNRAAGRRVFLCVGGPSLQRMALSAADGSTKVMCCRGDNAAVRKLFSLEPVIVLIEIDWGAIRQASGLVTVARSRWSKAFLIGYCLVGATALHEISIPVRAGLDAILFAGRGSIRQLLGLGIAEYADRSKRCVLPQPFSPSLHPLACRIAEHVVAHAAVAPNVNDVARAFGCSARTLARRFARAGLPTPDTLITRVRWSRIGDLLATGHVNSVDVAGTSGFADVKAMRAALKRRLGIGLRQLADTHVRSQLRRSLLHDFGAHLSPTIEAEVVTDA